MKTEHLHADAAGLSRAARLLDAGACVAIPTETVYGLAADATNGFAVASIYAAKERPSFNPLIVHVPDVAAAREIGRWDVRAELLARAFWPGPLTLVLRLRSSSALSELVTAGQSSVALRVPANETTRALLRRLGRPLAAPSANPSGRISPTTAAHVLAGLGGKISAVLDDGPCLVGLESTIVSLAGKPMLLRAGAVPDEDVEHALDGLGIAPRAPEDTTITAPGQLASHYAPAAALRLDAEAPREGEVYLGFGPGPADLNLSETADLKEAAANLFGYLHALDARGAPIAVAPIPETGLGRAINDRLRRAAAPRPG